MARRLPRVIPPFLITVFCLGLVEFGYQALEMYMDRAMNPEIQLEEAAPRPEIQPEAAVGETARDYKVIVERNLFGASLKDADAGQGGAVDTELAPAKTALELVLMGTVLGADPGQSRAFVLNLKAGKQEILKVGDTVEDASIKEIKRGQVILSLNGQDELMDMSDAARHRAPAPAVPGLVADAGQPTAASQVRRQAAASMPTAVRRPAVVKRRSIQPRTVRPARRVIPRRPPAVNN